MDVFREKKQGFSPLLPRSNVQEYPLRIPWPGVCLIAAICWLICAGDLSYNLSYNAAQRVPDLQQIQRRNSNLLFAETFWLFLLTLLLALLLPRRIVRESDTLRFEYPAWSSSIHVDEVLEISVVNSWVQLFEVLAKWGCFPFGWNLHLFFGLFDPRLRASPGCVVLTRRCCWSYILSLEETTTAFLLENQRALDLGKKYTNIHGILIRSEASMESAKVAIVPAGEVVTVEEQRGRRIRVRVEGSHIAGWMSYISVTGRMLLVQHSTQNSAGVVGASTLAHANSYGAVIELKSYDAPGGVE